MKKILLLVILALSFSNVPGLLSQTSVPIVGKFRTIGLGVERGDLYYTLKDSDIPVAISDGTRSVFYQCPEYKELVFYSIKTTPDLKKERLPVAKVDLTTGGSLPLIVFSPSLDKTSPPQIRILKDDLTSFPLGAFELFNLTSSPWEAVFDRKVSTLVPPYGQAMTMPQQDPSKTTLYFQPKKLAANGHQTVFCNNWVFPKNFRTLLLVQPSLGDASAPRVTRLQETADILFEVPKKR